MKFKHPLARSAKVWRAYGVDGETRDTLVVLTSLELDPEDKKYKSDVHERLIEAVRDYLQANPDKASGYLLMNKPKY